MCKCFYYFKGRYKKLNILKFWNCKNLKFWNCKKIEFMKRFYKQLFYSFKTAYGNADFIFHNFTATATATVWKKLISSVLKWKKKNRLEVIKKCYFSHVSKTPFYAVLILPKNAVSKRQLCLRFETPDYNHKRTLLYA